MIRLTGKIMEEKLKHGWTLKQLSDNYGISEEEFLEILRKTFSKKAYRSMISRMKKNENISHPKVLTTKKNTFDVPSSNELKQQSKTIIEEPSVSNEEEIKLLQARKNDMLTSLNDLELEHKFLTSARVQIRNKISDYKILLSKIQSEIILYQKELEGLIAELDEKFESMQVINLSISETRTAISEVQAKIDAMQQISILVYESGDVEIDSSLEFKIDPDECSSLFDQIINDDIAESLTIKQIRSLVKAVSLVQFLSSQKLAYEILFENQIAEKIFYKIIKEE